MAALLQSFRSSSMPKRLLRYCLSKLDLLDTDALNIENLDLALGRNTVFEFKDVGIKLKKLEGLLHLPPAFKLQKAKVLLLRVTVPIDFYTSPIRVEVDGVDIRLKVLGESQTNKPRNTKTPHDHSDLRLNTVDIAQSFLDTQPESERKKLEDALAAETHDLGASVSVSDDGSEDEQPLGTGQGLTLPAFLADFLQGISDNMQVLIKSVTFQLDLDVPVEPNCATAEPVSFQINLESVDVEGLTVVRSQDDELSASTSREGKRMVALSNVRAFLISEANVFSALARSPSAVSPSVASSPAMTRNPPSRQASSLTENLFSDPLPRTPQRTARPPVQSPDPGSPLGDSEIALNIPYDLSEPDDFPDDESPPTPRASVFHDMRQDDEESMFHSTTLSPRIRDPGVPERQEYFASSLTTEQELGLSDQGVQPSIAASGCSAQQGFEESSAPMPVCDDYEDAQNDELAQSRLYSHEEAESMYMSAFSNADSPTNTATDSDGHHSEVMRKSLEHHDKPKTPPSVMPGGWDESPSTSPVAPSPDLHELTNQDVTAREVPTEGGSRISIHRDDEAKPKTPPPAMMAENAATPKGPTRMVKEIFYLEKAAIYLPPQHQHVHIQDLPSESVAQMSESLDTSIYPQAPGAFSAHGRPALEQKTSSRPIEGNAAETEDRDETLEANFSPIQLNFDASIGVLLYMVFGHLLKATQRPLETPGPQAEGSGATQKPPSFKVFLEEISVNFLNRMGGVADTAERHLRQFSTSFLDQEVLLNATLQDLSITTSMVTPERPVGGKPKADQQPSMLSKIDIGKFRFGYADGDVVSFDQNRPMSTSVRDTFLSDGNDISMKILSGSDKVKTDIETLPLLVRVDLQRLDETFSWFGGLSGFLNMSASISSGHSPSTTSSPRLPQKPRGVRFETPIDPEDRSAAAQNKVNLRVGGALVELLGKECTVAANTSAIKLVSRDEGLGVAVSRLRVSGPYLQGSRADPAIGAEVTGVRLDFLLSPKNLDLEKLLDLITPSKVKFDGDSDEIMVDTLLRQRRKGSVLRVNVERVNIRVKSMAQLSVLPQLVEELSKLGTVAKYLPEDDRPGLLTLGKIAKLDCCLDFGGRLGRFTAEVRDFEVAHITMPSLVALAAHHLSVKRNDVEELLTSSTTAIEGISAGVPVIRARMVGDEMEPVVKVKLRHLTVEYRVPTIMDLLGLGEDTTPQEFEESLASSVANLSDQAHSAFARQPSPHVGKSKASKPTTIDVGFQDCLIGLNPFKLSSKMLIALTDAHLQAVVPKDVETKGGLDIKKASVLLTDDAAQMQAGKSSRNMKRGSSAASAQVMELCERGFVDICYISSARADLNVYLGPDGTKQVEVEVRDDLLVLETCADSTQTLITLANALTPPTPPTKELKYKIDVVPVQNLLASISAEAFGRPEGEYDFDQDFAGAQELAGSGSEAGYGSDISLRMEPKFYGSQGEGEELFDAMAGSDMSHGTKMQDTQEGVLVTGVDRTASQASADSEDLVLQDDFYGKGQSREHAAKVWNSSRNQYDRAPDDLVKRSPLRVSVRDAHIIWNLFDGYDWESTREVINKAVQDVENKALERQSNLGGPSVYEEEIEDEEAISDFLFNSIYIGIPANRDPQELTRAINEGLNDNATETESMAPTTVTATTSRTARPSSHQPRQRRLKLHRSKHHKITFELQGVNVDMYALPAGGETVSSVDVRVQNLDIFDHVPTSTWKKFATYDFDRGEREMGTSMVHIELLNVKPIPQLGASEIVMRATLLPLRLHVDQDALDFITRFFEFKDENVPVHSSKSDVPFIQRAEVNNVPVRLDFKPKRVDYAGLRSGHTTEFMNFIVLEEARMVLRHVIIYGVPGFDRLGKTLNDIWMPDVRTNQLPGVVAGLAPVRSIVNIGSGFRDLVEIPIREYQKDGRVVRSISKGAAAFARTTGTELVKLGAKLAVGTQYALQGAEGMLMDQQKPQQPLDSGWEDDELDAEEKKQISLYAEQPTGVMQGIRGGYRSLTRDMNLARDAIIAVPGEVMESQSAGGVAKAVWKRAPTIIFRPAVGVSKVIGQTLMGATNTIDPQHRRRIDEKYKKH